MIEDSLYDDWVPLCKRDKLSFGRIMAIASGNLIPGLMYNIIFALLSPTRQLLGLPPIAELMLLLAGSLIGFFLAPLLGVLSDGLMFKYGRRRIFIVIGTIVAVASLLLLSFYDKIGSTVSQKKIIFIFSIILAFLSVNVIQSPARVLCSDVTPPNQQNQMSNICQVFGGIAPIVSNLLGGLKLKAFGLKETEFLLVICVSVAVLAMIVVCIAAREEPLRVKPPKVNPFKQTFRAFKKIPRPFSRVILPFLFANMAIYQFQIKFTDFMGRDIYEHRVMYSDEDTKKAIYENGVKRGMLCMTVNGAAQLIYSFINSKIVDSLGMKWTMVIGNSLMTVCLLIFIWVRQEYAFFAIVGLLGISQVIFTAIPYAIVSLVIPTEELGNNLGILNCFCVIGQQISNFGLGYFVDGVFGKDIYTLSTKKIGFSAVFGALTVLASFWIVQPSLAETGNYNQIDESGTGAVSGLSIAE
ncbi:hypothetical protein M9Y10_027797 [Tritrichomonas musculus]|uniref:Major facilitator superfamily (MFS) profile domain-containing protein n=1 Tax=Tritrichomonas musculus TaxID=1915356 RepID=A0ABR2H532_9EUKA